MSSYQRKQYLAQYLKAHVNIDLEKYNEAEKPVEENHKVQEIKKKPESEEDIPF
jgi:hypothetical protein